MPMNASDENGDGAVVGKFVGTLIEAVMARVAVRDSIDSIL